VLTGLCAARCGFSHSLALSPDSAQTRNDREAKTRKITLRKAHVSKVAQKQVLPSVEPDHLPAGARFLYIIEYDADATPTSDCERSGHATANGFVRFLGHLGLLSYSYHQEAASASQRQ